MFSNGVDHTMTRPNDKGEFEVAHGISAEIFSSILVSRAAVCRLFQKLVNPFRTKTQNINSQEEISLYCIIKLAA